MCLGCVQPSVGTLQTAEAGVGLLEMLVAGGAGGAVGRVGEAVSPSPPR